MMEKIKAGNTAGTLSYDSVSDKFTMSANREGVANKLTLSSDFKTLLKLNEPTVSEQAKDAKLTVNGVSIVKSENVFTLNGATYTLNSTHTTGTAIDIKFSVNSTAIKEKIKGLVDSYNGIITSVYDKLDEKVYRSFKPLTDEQKKELKEADVTTWEAKAKSGLLRNNTDLENVVSRMRQALQDTVEGAGLTLSDIGITTSTNYKEHGKLIISDDAKLTSAIENNYSSVVKLFTTESDKTYADKPNATERYLENGLGNRIYDILQDAVRTTREGSDTKGTLVEIAGIKNDTSEFTSSLSLKITEYDEKITTLLNYLADKENGYYAQFSKMEAALNKLNAQSSSLMSQFGGK
jgi:flagellar hook-associated protein 2